MKIIRVIILVAVVVSFMPFDACCDELNETTKERQEMVLCLASCCHSVTLSNNDSVNLPIIQEVSFNLQNGFTYEAPFLATEERPPLSILS